MSATFDGGIGIHSPGAYPQLREYILYMSYRGGRGRPRDSTRSGHERPPQLAHPHGFGALFVVSGVDRVELCRRTLFRWSLSAPEDQNLGLPKPSGHPAAPGYILT